MKQPAVSNRVVQVRLSIKNFKKLNRLIEGSITAYKYDHDGERIITSSLAKRIYKQLWAALKEGQFEP